MIAAKATPAEFAQIEDLAAKYGHDSIAGMVRVAINFYFHHCDPKTGKLK